MEHSPCCDQEVVKYYATSLLRLSTSSHKNVLCMSCSCHRDSQRFRRALKNCLFSTQYTFADEVEHKRRSYCLHHRYQNLSKIESVAYRFDFKGSRLPSCTMVVDVTSERLIWTAASYTEVIASSLWREWVHTEYNSQTSPI